MAIDKNFTAQSMAHRAQRLLRREYRRSSIVALQTRAAFSLFGRTARLILLAGCRTRRQTLVLPSAIYVPGLFSAFATVLGLLEHYDNWRRRYAGVQVDFGNAGLYYDPSTGPNWWQYFFEPIHSEVDRMTPRTIISDDEQFFFARRVEKTMPRKRGFALIDRYVRPQPHIRAKVDAFVRTNFEGAYVIGVHYRGTDKFQDAPRVPYERVHAAVVAAATDASAARYKLYVATDEQAFLDYMLGLFPGRVHHLEMYRSIDGGPIDVMQGDNRRKGEDAVLDCLLLSRCDYLVRTASNLGLCAALFNPHMPVNLLNREQ